MKIMLDFQDVTKSFGDGEGKVDVLKKCPTIRKGW